MKLYSGSSAQFVDDATFNRIAAKLRSAFFEAYGFKPSEGERKVVAEFAPRALKRLPVF